MEATKDVIYENHLKREYAVDKGADSFIITSTSCYWLGEETLWLISELPQNAEKHQYLNKMAALGLGETNKIFNKLLNIGVLRVMTPQKVFKKIVTYILGPQVKLLSAQLQHKVLNFFGFSSSSLPLKNVLKPLIISSAVGLIFGLVITLTGFGATLIKSSSGQPQVAVIFTLILLGSLIHELGYSFTAAASGIGLRPIGFAVYLFYPVFYTNVSGMEKLPLWKKVAIDCGGFIAQSAYLFILVAIYLVTRNISCLESIRWISLIMAFNLNPLLRTDGYWLYKDIRKSLGNIRIVNYAHYLYLTAFFIFSGYLFFHIYSGLGSTFNFLVAVFEQPKRLLYDGHRIVLGSYFIIMAFVGGLRRLKEGHQEWIELRKENPATSAEKALETA